MLERISRLSNYCRQELTRAELRQVRAHEGQYHPRGSGWVPGMELRPIEHECNGPTRYREVVLTSRSARCPKASAQSASLPKGETHE